MPIDKAKKRILKFFLCARKVKFTSTFWRKTKAFSTTLVYKIIQLKRRMKHFIKINTARFLRTHIWRFAV